MGNKVAGLRVGVYVDVENLMRNGGRGLRFDTLREFACRDGGEAIRLNAYLAFDDERAQRDADYRYRSTRYHFALRDVGFKVIEKPVHWYTNEDGVRVSKSNSDLDLAVDMLLQSAKLDRVVLVSGDGDFVQVVRALQNMGCRVELVGCQNVSYDLRCEADLFISGFLIPGLLPQPAKLPPWGEAGSRVRGTCYHYNAEKGFGFLRYLVDLKNLTITDTREAESPYRDAFFHCSQCPPDFQLSLLPSRDMIFEFTLNRGRDETKLEATDLDLVISYGHGRR
ncbi:MAG: NYN domain-containing protein [Planctomycetia bacterium]|nr:NYN domain-containing protein [Planctomycetia bacterium]